MLRAPWSKVGHGRAASADENGGREDDAQRSAGLWRDRGSDGDKERAAGFGERGQRARKERNERPERTPLHDGRGAKSGRKRPSGPPPRREGLRRREARKGMASRPAPRRGRPPQRSPLGGGGRRTKRGGEPGRTSKRHLRAATRRGRGRGRRGERSGPAPERCRPHGRLLLQHRVRSLPRSRQSQAASLVCPFSRRQQCAGSSAFRAPLQQPESRPGHRTPHRANSCGRGFAQARPTHRLRPDLLPRFVCQSGCRNQDGPRRQHCTLERRRVRRRPHRTRVRWGPTPRPGGDHRCPAGRCRVRRSSR